MIEGLFYRLLNLIEALATEFKLVSRGLRMRDDIAIIIEHDPSVYSEESNSDERYYCHSTG